MVLNWAIHTVMTKLAVPSFRKVRGAMADSLKSTIKSESTPFYCSLLFDGSTDQTISEKEIISIKFLENGEPKIRLLG